MQVHWWGNWCHHKELLTFVSRNGKLAVCTLLRPQSEPLMGIFSISHASRSKACSPSIYNPTSPLCATLPCGQQISKLYWSLWPFKLFFFPSLNCILPPPIFLLLLACRPSSSSYCLPWITRNIGRKWVSDITITALTLASSSVPLLLIHFASLSACLALSWATFALTNTNGCSAWNKIFFFF